MVGLKFFFDSDKEIHWIGVVERQLAKLSDVSAIEIGIVLLLLYGISTQLPAHDAMTYLVSGIFGLLTYIAVDALGGLLERDEEPRPASSCARALPPSSISKCSTPPSRSTG